MLATVLSWSAVLTSCAGGPEDVVLYDVAALMVMLSAWEAGPDGALNPRYVWMDLSHMVEATANPRTVLPDPPADSVLFWAEPPVAIDAAGNRSDEACQ